MSATRKDDTLTVTGPGCEGREAPNLNSALSLAQYHAEHADSDVTFYVRQADGSIVGRVERQQHSIVVYRRSAS